MNALNPKDFDTNPLSLLQTAVINQLGYDELTEGCITTLEDIASHGADAGWEGFTYYSDTGEFYVENKAPILTALEEAVEAFGSDGVVSLVKTFKCAQDSTEDEIAQTLYSSEIDTYVAKCLAWFALEQVAYELTGE